MYTKLFLVLGQYTREIDTNLSSTILIYGEILGRTENYTVYILYYINPWFVCLVAFGLSWSNIRQLCYKFARLEGHSWSVWQCNHRRKKQSTGLHVLDLHSLPRPVVFVNGKGIIVWTVDDILHEGLFVFGFWIPRCQVVLVSIVDNLNKMRNTYEFIKCKNNKCLECNNESWTLTRHYNALRFVHSIPGYSIWRKVYELPSKWLSSGVSSEGLC